MQDCSEDVVFYGSRIALQVWDGCFIQADRNWPHLLRGTATQIQAWEIFTVVPAVSNWDAWGWWVCYGHKIALRASSGFYVQADYGPQGDGEGELHAYDYRQHVEGWETFEVVPACSEELEADTPLKFSDAFSLKGWNHNYVCCYLDRAERCLATVASIPQEWEALRFVDPRAQNLKQSHEEFLQQRKDLTQARRQFQDKQARQDEKEKALSEREEKLSLRQNDLTSLDTSLKQQRSSLTQQQQELMNRVQVIDQQKTTLQQREEQLVRQQQFEADWAEALAENNQHTLSILMAQSKELSCELLERGKQRRLIEAEAARILKLEEQLKITAAQLKALPLLNTLQTQIEQLQREEEGLQIQMLEREGLKQRLQELEENIERLLALVNEIPTLRAQIEALEVRLEGGGVEVSGLEARLLSLSSNLLVLSEGVLTKLCPELNEKLRQADECERTLRETSTALEAAQQRYQNVEPLLVERCAILQKYQMADALIASTLDGVGEAEGATPLLEKAEELLAATDRVLRQAIEANTEAKALETLRLNGE